MRFIFHVFFISNLFLAPGSWGQESIYGRQCAETDTNTRQCARYHNCRAPRAGETNSVECLCYKSWANLYPEIWKQVVAQSSSPDYRAIGTGPSDSIARQDAKATCSLMFDRFRAEFVPGSANRAEVSGSTAVSALTQAYEVADEYCSSAFVCEAE